MVQDQVIERELNDVRNGLASLKFWLGQNAEWWDSLTPAEQEAVIEKIHTTHQSVGGYLLAQLSGHLSEEKSLFEAVFTPGSSHPLIDQRVLDHVTSCPECKFVVYRDFRPVQAFFIPPFVRSEEAEALLKELLETA